MKKKILGVLTFLIVTLFIFSFKSNPLKILRPPTINETLNGVAMSTAITGINNFAAYYDKDINIKSVSTWYSFDQIKNINTLLLQEEKTKGTDGVRIYFACDQPKAGSTKLKPSILLVSTKPQTPTIANQSTHGDYYDHVSGMLSAGISGTAINDNAPMGLSQGATLYNNAPPVKDQCANPSEHYISDSVAYAWVQRRCENNTATDVSAFNTKSEWFPLCFVSGLFNAILNPNNHIDGLRIYLGKGFIDKDKVERDVFILVPTVAGTINGTHKDYYSCLEDFSPSPFCKDSRNPVDFDHKRFPLGGYDKGELCPYNCN